MPCTKKAVWNLISKPSGDHVPSCEEHKTLLALDLSKTSEVVLSSVDPLHAPDCCYLTDEDLRNMLLD